MAVPFMNSDDDSMSNYSPMSQAPASSSKSPTVAEPRGERPRHDPQAASSMMIRPGTNIVSWDLQHVGRVRRVETDPATGLPARLIVQRATGATTDICIPIRFIERILAGEVYLSLSLEQLNEAL